jgi:DNA excision repair protein ERCC-4
LSEAIEKYPIDVIELNQPMSKRMMEIQQAIMEVIYGCIQELRKACLDVDFSEFTLENAMFKKFDHVIQQQLNPIWHRLSPKTQQLVNDMKILRKLQG